MKLFVVAVFLTAIFGQINSLPRAGEDLAEKIREIITKIIENVVDPIGVKDVTVKIPTNNLINGEFDISEITLSGLKKLSIDTLTYDESSSRLDYAFNFEDIISVIETDLVLTGLIEIDHPLSIKVDFKNFKIEGYAVIAKDEKHVDDFKILVTLGESDFDIKGLLNDDKLSEEVSKTLTENVAKVIDEMAPVLSPIFSEIIKVIINIVLKIEG